MAQPAAVGRLTQAGRRRQTFHAPQTGPWDTYGRIKDRAERAIAFIEGECIVPEGRGTNHPYRLRPWQRTIIRKALSSGTIVSVLSGPRGLSKSGIAAALAVWALFDRPAAQVLVLGTSMRTAGIVYGRARRIIELNPRLRDHAMIHLNMADPYVELPDRGSSMRPLPAEERYIVGGSPTQIIVDEVGYVTNETFEVMQTSLGKVEGGHLFAMGTPGLGPVGTDSLPNLMWSMRTRALGESPARGVAWIEFAARPDDPPGHRRTWKRANPALGDLVGWTETALDFQTMPPARFGQMRLGLWTQHETAWMPIDMWQGLDVVPGDIPDGSLISLGFDGSTSRDTTALVAFEHMRRRWVVLGHWKPDGTRGWLVPRHEVIDRIHSAFGRYHVTALYADPWHWRSELETLTERYGERVIAWNTASITTMGPATDGVYAAISKREVAWDGTEALRVHVLAAVARQTQAGSVIVKDAKRPQPIDLAIAAILAHEAARLIPPSDHSVF